MVESQIGALVGQSFVVKQPTHAPVVGSHTLGCPAPVGHVIPPLVQAAWHVLSEGQHTGVDPLPQSALVTHVTQVPLRQ